MTATHETLIQNLVEGLTDERSLRAGAFIVTLYGDVVVPRGGALWIGNVIETCGTVGISETLVRTAVSRLVAAGRLTGDRVGRRSFYRLAEAAYDEFDRASAILYADPATAPATDWTIAVAVGIGRRPMLEALSKAGFGVVGQHVALHPGDRREEAEAALNAIGTADRPLIFQASLSRPGDRKSFAALGVTAWDLEALDAGYREFLDRFTPLSIAMKDSTALQATDLADPLALSARLLLVHEYRRTALRDPHLPKEVLPTEWQGGAAKSLFADLYPKLSGAADRHIDRCFVDANGPLKADEGVLERRLSSLSGRDD